MTTATLKKPNPAILLLIIFMFFTGSCTTNSQEEDLVIDDNTENPVDDNTGDDEDDEESEPEHTAYDISSILSIFSDHSAVVTYEISGDNVIISTTNLPNHTSPYYLNTQWHDELYEAYNGTNSAFHLNPNRIGEQDITFTIPLHPEAADFNEETPMGPMGVSRNGVVFFNQYAAGRSALDGEIDSFDQYLGHPTGGSAYHYHIEPTYLTDMYGEDALLGLLADGFPVYGPKEDGETISSEDLDDFHGHYGTTQEFPNGIYHYHVTADAPYINGDGFYGSPGNISR